MTPHDWYFARSAPFLCGDVPHLIALIKGLSGSSSSLPYLFQQSLRSRQHCRCTGAQYRFLGPWKTSMPRMQSSLYRTSVVLSTSKFLSGRIERHVRWIRSAPIVPAFRSWRHRGLRGARTTLRRRFLAYTIYWWGRRAQGWSCWVRNTTGNDQKASLDATNRHESSDLHNESVIQWTIFSGWIIKSYRQRGSWSGKSQWRSQSPYRTRSTSKAIAVYRMFQKDRNALSHFSRNNEGEPFSARSGEWNVIRHKTIHVHHSAGIRTKRTESM